MSDEVKDTGVETGENESVSTEKTQPAVEPQPEQQPVNLDNFPEFRKYKSVRDKTDASMREETTRLQQQISQLETEMLELVDDPAKRAALQTQRLQAQVSHYQQLDNLVKQREAISNRWGVPETVLKGTENPSVMTAQAMDYLQKQASEAQVQLAEATKVEKIKKTETAGGHRVSTASGTPPDVQEISSQSLDKQILDLRTTAQAGGAAGRKARLSILKLEAKRQKSRTKRAKV